MTDVISKISGQFSRALLLGAFLPTVIFAVLGLLLLPPILPADLSVLAPLAALGPEWKVATGSFFALVLSGLLYNLNIPIIRFYEGYPWKESWFGRRRILYYQARFRAVQARFRGLRTLVYKLPDPDESEPFATQLQKRKNKEVIGQYWQYVGLRVNLDYPGREGLVLPTRLGNVIRSFEYYPELQYGIDSIVLWPRLISKIDKDYAGAIDEAKTSFDFMINCSVLSALLCMIMLASGLLSAIPFSEAGALITWFVEMLGLAGGSYFAYVVSHDRAQAWGGMVKAAYDLYRGDLLTQLGHKQLPATVAQERLVWDDLSLQLQYGDSPRIPLAVYEAKPGLARAAQPNTMELPVFRAVSLPMRGKVFVRLSVTNDQPILAQGVVVLDAVPDEYDYVWETEVLEQADHSTNQKTGESAAIRVVGVNPYRFYIGDLQQGQTKVVRYAIAKRA